MQLVLFFERKGHAELDVEYLSHSLSDLIKKTLRKKPYQRNYSSKSQNVWKVFIEFLVEPI